MWLARDRRHDRLVAIKVLHPELAGAIGVDRFVREIRLTARLQHPNIVPVLDSGVFPGADARPLPWFAMAYIPGESLRARLQRERQLPIDEAVRIAADAARTGASGGSGATPPPPTSTFSSTCAAIRRSGQSRTTRASGRSS